MLTWLTTIGAFLKSSSGWFILSLRLSSVTYFKIMYYGIVLCDCEFNILAKYEVSVVAHSLLWCNECIYDLLTLWLWTLTYQTVQIFACSTYGYSIITKFEYSTSSVMLHFVPGPGNFDLLTLKWHCKFNLLWTSFVQSLTFPCYFYRDWKARRTLIEKDIDALTF